MVKVFVASVCFIVACAATGPEISGSTTMVDISPANRPALVGALDFDLLAEGAGKACVDRDTSKVYWMGMADMTKLAADPLTRQAIAAAINDAVSRLDGVDSILLTRVVTDSKGPDRVCATIVGRGVRLKKARQQLGPSEEGSATGSGSDAAQ